jgi:hypothetical protein
MPLAPTPVVPAPPPAPVATDLVTFIDPFSGGATSDVRDIDDQIVRFNFAGELIWVADGTRFPGFPIVQRSYIMADASYQVRFGIKDGQRRAYFGAHDQDLLYDLENVNGHLVITGTNVPVPGTRP